MTLASLKKAEALVALEVGSDTMVAAAGTGWRATDSSPRDKLHALGDFDLIPFGRVRGEVVDSRHFIRFHGSGGRSGEWDGQVGPLRTCPSALGRTHLRRVSFPPMSGLSFHPRLLHPTTFLRHPLS